MSSRLTGHQRILRHFLTFGSITPLEAIYDYGETRLAARVHILRKQGYGITTHDHEVTNRFGEKRIVARYTLDSLPPNHNSNADSQA